MYHKWQSCDPWFFRYGVGRENLLSFWTIFCPFTLLRTQKIKIFKNWKKTHGDIIILHLCTTNDNHMMYGSWDMKHDRQNFFSFWAIFCPFYPTNNPKNQNFGKMKKKKHFGISSFNTSVPKIMIICYTVPDIWPVTDVICIFHFGLFFTLLPPNSPANQNLKKRKKNTRWYHHFRHVPKIMITWVWFLRSGAWQIDGQKDGQMDGQMDRQKKWHIEVDPPPKKQHISCMGAKNANTKCNLLKPILHYWLISFKGCLC